MCTCPDLYLLSDISYMYWASPTHQIHTVLMWNKLRQAFSASTQHSSVLPKAPSQQPISFYGATNICWKMVSVWETTAIFCPTSCQKKIKWWWWWWGSGMEGIVMVCHWWATTDVSLKLPPQRIAFSLWTNPTWAFFFVKLIVLFLKRESNLTGRLPLLGFNMILLIMVLDLITVKIVLLLGKYSESKLPMA